MDVLCIYEGRSERRVSQLTRSTLVSRFGSEARHLIIRAKQSPFREQWGVGQKVANCCHASTKNDDRLFQPFPQIGNEWSTKLWERAGHKPNITCEIFNLAFTLATFPTFWACTSWYKLVQALKGFL